MAKALEAKFGEPRKAQLTWKPHNTVPVDDETGEAKLLKLIDLLNEHDDVQNTISHGHDDHCDDDMLRIFDRDIEIATASQRGRC